MKQPLLFTIALFSFFKCFALSAPADSLKQQQATVNEDRLTLLKTQIDSTQTDSVKAFLYAEVAALYLNYDSIATKKVKLKYQNETLNYTYKALHLFSKYDDSVGLRNCFDNLATVYHSQKKYPQAKWFILQSNAMSRALNDVPNVMKSLIKLAAIKMDIKDYSLAMSDLNEALKLSVNNRDPQTESKVQLNYALLYNRMKNFKKGKIALERHNFLDDSIRKEQLALVAKAAQNDSTSVKKKLPAKLAKKTLRTDSSKKIASL